jgi:ABC-type lipoprotein export system ATPase subunit
MKDITKFYSSGFIKTFVLRDINLDVEEGEFLTIMGPSGAGKSTLLHILGMLDSRQIICYIGGKNDSM